MKQQIEGKGWAAAIAAWMILDFMLIRGLACLKADRCSSGDMMLFALLSLGLVVPAYVIGLIFQELFGGKE